MTAYWPPEWSRSYDQHTQTWTAEGHKIENLRPLGPGLRWMVTCPPDCQRRPVGSKGWTQLAPAHTALASAVKALDGHLNPHRSTDPADWVGACVRNVYGRQGRAVAYSSDPTILVELADGARVTWRADQVRPAERQPTDRADLLELLRHAAHLLGRLAKDSPCRLDHHGQCQEHDMHLPRCPHATARELLGQLPTRVPEIPPEDYR